MAAEVIRIDQRQHTREGVMGQLEDITYAALRKYANSIKANSIKDVSSITATVRVAASA
jgi:hypothetical protein